MASPIFNPFSFNPANTGRASGSYTVPAGKYAYVVISVKARANCSVSDASFLSSSALIANINGVGETVNESIQLWLDAGDAITSSLSNASGSAQFTANASSNNQFIDITSTISSVTVNLGGSAIMEVNAVSTASISGTDDTATTGAQTYATFAGDTDCYITYTEYNKTT